MPEGGKDVYLGHISKLLGCYLTADETAPKLMKYGIYLPASR